MKEGRRDRRWLDQDRWDFGGERRWAHGSAPALGVA